jgi:hypothetical protein
MRSLLVAAALIGLVAQTGSAQGREISAALDGASPEVGRKILALEKQRITAMVSKDIKGLAALLGEDLTYTHSGGTTDTKASFLTLIKERGRYLGIDYSNAQAIPLTGNTVVVRGRAQIRLEGTPAYAVLFLDVWALRDGGWKMVAWQATRIPE